MSAVLAPSSLVCEFFVEGDPVPQGSKSGFVNPRTGRVIMADANSTKLKPWRKAIAEQARLNYWSSPVETAVVLVCDFQFVRPKSVKRPFPSVAPDLDKLARAVCDGITDSGVWKDDALVVAIHASKVYAERAGVTVRIHELEGNRP